MTRYAAFLRAINVSNRRVTNADLAACFEGLGFEDVETFRAAGNLVFADAKKADPSSVCKRLESGLAKALGFEVPVYLRTEKEMRAIAGHEPFDPKLVAASDGKLQVALMLDKLTPAKRKRALAHSSDEDRLAIRGTELYWLPSGGMSDSELDLKAITEVIGPYTMRTKGTMDLIAQKWFGA